METARSLPSEAIAGASIDQFQPVIDAAAEIGMELLVADAASITHQLEQHALPAGVSEHLLALAAEARTAQLALLQANAREYMVNLLTIERRTTLFTAHRDPSGTVDATMCATAVSLVSMLSGAYRLRWETAIRSQLTRYNQSYETFCQACVQAGVSVFMVPLAEGLTKHWQTAQVEAA